jgi:hypothetical protein
MGDGNCARDWNTISDQLGRTEETLHERSVTPDESRKIRPSAMRVIKAGRREAFMMTFLFVAVLAILGFLWCTGPDGPFGPRHRH